MGSSMTRQERRALALGALLALFGCNKITGVEDLRFDPCANPSTATLAPAIEGGTGGKSFADVCHDGQVIIGFSWKSHPIYLSGLAAICGTLRLSDDEPYSIDVEPEDALPARGEVGEEQTPVMCPENQMVVGFEGRTYTDAGGKIFMAALTLRCAPLLMSGDLESPRLAIGAITTTAPLGSAVGDPFDAVDCPEGGIAFASLGASGQWVDAFGVGCAEPSFDCHEEH